MTVEVGETFRFKARLVYPDPDFPDSQIIAYASKGFVLLDMPTTANIRTFGRIITGVMEEKGRIPRIRVLKWISRPNILLPDAVPISDVAGMEPPYRTVVTGEVVQVAERSNEVDILIERTGEQEGQRILVRTKTLFEKANRPITSLGTVISVTGVRWLKPADGRPEPLLLTRNKRNIQLITSGTAVDQIHPEDVQSQLSRSARLQGWFLERNSRGHLLFSGEDNFLFTVAPLPHASPKPGGSYFLDGRVSKTDGSSIELNAFALRKANAPSKSIPETPISDQSTRGNFVTMDGKVTHVRPKINGRLHLQLEPATANGPPIRVSVPPSLAEGPIETVKREDRITASGMVEETAPGLTHVILTNQGDIQVTSPSRKWLPVLVALGVLAALLSLVIGLAFWLQRLVRVRTADLTRSRVTLASIQNSIPEAILACHADGRVFNFNDRCREWFGLTDDQVGQPESAVLARISEVLPETRQDDWKNVLATTRKRPASFVQFSYSLGPPNAPLPKHLECCRVPLHRGLNKPGILWIFRDISARKELEQSLQQAQKLEAIGLLTGGIAHDFNNLLTGIIGNLSLLEMDIEDTEQRDMISDAQASADRARELVAQMLGYARKSRLNPIATSLNALSADLYNLLSRSLPVGINIQFDLQESLPLTLIDRKKIEQVLMNLILNAVDAIDGQGRIILRSGQDDENRVFVDIADDGPGIPPDIQEKIFDPFFTTKEQGKGTGLGLSVALGIVEQHGGRITCHSSPTEGTRFRVAFPIATAQEVERGKLEAPDHPKTQPSREPMAATVLVVDDEPSVLAITRNMLKRLGCKPICVPNGEEAIRTLEKEPGVIDVVLSDNAMPIMGGVETFRRVAHQFPTLPFIVASGYLVDLEEYAEVAEGRLPDYFIAKPFEINRLADAIHSVTSGASSN